MGNLLADIFVTCGGQQSAERVQLVKRSLQSLRDSTERSLYRLTACIDGSSLAIAESFAAQTPLFKTADYILISAQNEGLGPTINRAVAHIVSINDWYGHPTHGDPTLVAPFIVGCQDDCEYEPGWLSQLASRFMAYERVHNLGFATGHEAVEHVKTRLPVIVGNGMHLQDWVRMTNLLGRREYWASLMPIPRLDPETGRVRARPNDGMGSSVDWWMLRNAPNSVCRTGRTNLVVPGLVRHAGHSSSTWLDRSLPESEADMDRMKEHGHG